MTKLGCSVNKLKLDLFLVLPRDIGHQTLQAVKILPGSDSFGMNLHVGLQVSSSMYCLH